MILTLEVVGQQAQQLGSAAKKVFRAVGGTIGRLADNDWVIPDPYVSGRHALIRYLNGKFFVEDTSTNGVYINSQDNRLRRSEPHPLKNGDRLFIDAYEIRVSIANERPAAGDARNPADMLARRLMGQPAARPAPPPAEEPDRTEALDRSRVEDGETDFEEVDPLEDEEDDDGEGEGADEGKTQYFSFDQAPERKPEDEGDLPTRYQPPPSAQPPRNNRPAMPPSQRPLSQPPSVPREVVRPSAPPPPQPPKQQAPARPQARDVASGSGRFPAPPVPPAQPAAKPSADTEAFKALLTAAGIQGVEPSAALGQELGEVLRTVVDGLMEVLRTRERFKDEFRVRATTFKPAHNNPLKFSANVEDALHNLLFKNNSAYLTPQEAFEDAFIDVRNHEMAIIASMRAAFEAMLDDFDPDKLQEEFDRQLKKGSLLGVPAKLRYWDLFRDLYAELNKNTDGSFKRLFGEEFAKSYEERLEQVRAQSPRGEK
jgi:type VI secretion system FHA domain protein